MKMVDEIISIMELDGIPIKDKAEARRSINEGIDNGNYKFIINAYGEVVGFLTWENNENEIYVNNLFVLKKFAGESKLYKLRGFFRTIYPNKRLNWINAKKNKKRVAT